MRRESVLTADTPAVYALHVLGPRSRLTNLLGQWLQCQANNSATGAAACEEGVCLLVSEVHVQGYLAHKKTPAPLGPP